MTGGPKRTAALEEALQRLCARLEVEPEAIDALFGKAQLLALLGQDEKAKEAFLSVLQLEPTHLGALTDLGGLSLATGYRSAALTLYRQAAVCHPQSPTVLVNLANLLSEENDLTEARRCYEAALQLDPGLAFAHQGLAAVLARLGEHAAADEHRRMGYAGHSMVARPFRGKGDAVSVLLTVSALGGNIPTELLLDGQLFAVTALYAEYHDPALALPPHDVVFNAVGDADLCHAALAEIPHILARTKAPAINPPERILPTGRSANAQRLADVEGVVVPRTVLLSRAALERPDAAECLHKQGFAFPVLLRAPGFHTGQHFLRAESPNDLAGAVAQVPGSQLFVIQYLDARGHDGLVRKYRVMSVDGGLYPLHLAISRDWKVHYFTSDMAADAAFRREEAAFLADMPAVLGPGPMRSLTRLRDALRLDYGGIDFGVSAKGNLLLFEANATMVIALPPPEPIWDYRRKAAAQALEAARQMVFARAGTSAGS
ncbi:MAG: tetratricopeptide repeat protein [Alphaproteobacteria bacterium]|nr:tetratricopeptide repeat protein [Alphaproteobacteria bacterium]MDE2110360.1 tetratricopeptide repeat protein [Alphaproteobacteria bacterium]